MIINQEDGLVLGGTAPRNFVTYRLSRLQAKLNIQASALLEDYAGLTLSKWRILALVGVSGQTNLSIVSRETGLDKGLLSRNLKAMVEEGLVISEPDESDHRVHLLSLTIAGQKIFEETLPKMQLRQQRLEENLTEQELATLFSAFEKLYDAADWRGDDD